MDKNENCLTRRSFLCAMAAGAASLSLLPVLSGCSGGEQGVTGMWYGVDDEGNTSTLEINEDGTWLFNGKYSADGDWNETDSGTIVLSAALVSVPLKLEGSGDERVLSFAGKDPSRGTATDISESTFYATEEARDAASAE